MTNKISNILGVFGLILLTGCASPVNNRVNDTELTPDANLLEHKAIVVTHISAPGRVVLVPIMKDIFADSNADNILTEWRRISPQSSPGHSDLYKFFKSTQNITLKNFLLEDHEPEIAIHMVDPGTYMLDYCQGKNWGLDVNSQSLGHITFTVKAGEAIYIGHLRLERVGRTDRMIAEVHDKFDEATKFYHAELPGSNKPLIKRLMVKK